MNRAVAVAAEEQLTDLSASATHAGSWRRMLQGGLRVTTCGKSAVAMGGELQGRLMSGMMKNDKKWTLK